MIKNAAKLFNLSECESESLANKSGLSLLCCKNLLLSEAMKDKNIKQSDLIRRSAVSERMFQYYIKGKKPTKQALLAIALSLGLQIDEINSLMNTYGYCLSKSLPNDAVVLWFLKNYYTQKNNTAILNLINDVLEKLELPMLMTKFINR